MNNIPPVWLENLFRTIDARDAAGFAEFFTLDGWFVYGALPPVQGRENIKEFADAFFKTLTNLEHKITKFLETQDMLYIHFDSTYFYPNGKSTEISGLNALEIEGGLISRYVVYMDLAPLMALQKEQEE